MGNVLYAMGYLDNITIFSNSNIRDIFEKLYKAELKLKLLKCAFFKKKLQYLGHLVLEGVWHIPEKLESIQNMSVPRNAKEVKQFLGLVGYYQKFVPDFSNIVKPLSKLTTKNQIFAMKTFAMNWYSNIQIHWSLIHCSQMQALLTDGQEYNPIDNKGNQCTTLHPVAYVSGLFRGSQLNWAALTKEAYAIYMFIKRLTFYISGTKVTLWSDHLPLKKFLLKDTLNERVNRLATEIEDYQTEFNHIKGKNKSLSRHS